MLVILSGLPGVGKSRIATGLARRMPAVVVAVDSIEDAILRSGVPMSFETGVAAYTVGATVATTQLRNGLDVIADAANYVEVGRDVWRTAARSAESAIRVIDVVCSDEDEHRRRLASRQRGLAAYPEPTWDAVIQRRNETEPWAENHLVLDTVLPIGENLDRAMEFLDH